MKLKKLLAATSLALAALGAQATPLDSLTGNVNIKLVGQTTETNTQANTNETTWGLGVISEISGTGGKLWQSGTTDGSYLYYMLYGISDQNVITHPNGVDFDIYNIGASGIGADNEIHLDIYRTTTRILQLDSDYNANPNGRTGYDSHTLLAGLGDAYLKVVFGAGKQLSNVSAPAGGSETDALADETLATLVQHTKGDHLPTDGIGSFFADAVGGTALSQWNTNGQFGHDFDGKFTLSANGEDFGSGTCSAADVAGGNCFAGLINDPIRALKIPEPGTLAIFGLGLAGLAAIRRRKA